MLTFNLEHDVALYIYKNLIEKRERILNIYIACKEHNSPCFKENWWHEFVESEIKKVNKAINTFEQELHPDLISDLKKG